MPSWIQTLKDSPKFWEVAFILALVLLILAHKVTLEAMVEA